MPVYGSIYRDAEGETERGPKSKLVASAYIVVVVGRQTAIVRLRAAQWPGEEREGGRRGGPDPNENVALFLYSGASLRVLLSAPRSLIDREFEMEESLV